MGIWNSFKNYINQTANQERVNTWFCRLFFLVILLNLLWRASISLPQNGLFFFTSDAFEFFLTSVIAYLFYYKVLPSESIRFKFLSIFSFGILLFGLAYLKTYRRDVLHLQGHVFEEFTSFVGMTGIFSALFYYVNHLNFYINNSFVKTEKALKEAEQQLLRQQFNPHFLYNAFNSLYSMSLQQHPKTSESILKLSGMMRYLTDDINHTRTPLKRELKFIEDYLAIERIRFGDQANISFELKGSIEGQLIEPLLLMILVENAFKHGFYTNNPQAFVQIIVDIKEKSVVFTVKNSRFQKQHFQEQERKGMGLENLQKRLALVYGADANLEIDTTEKVYTASLQISI